MLFWFLLEPGYHFSGFLHLNGFNVGATPFLIDLQKALHGMTLSPEHTVTDCPVAGIFELGFELDVLQVALYFGRLSNVRKIQ